MSKEAPTKKSAKELTPREKVVEMIYDLLQEAEHKGSAQSDPYGAALTLLEEIERRALGVDDKGTLIFCDPDIPVKFL